MRRVFSIVIILFAAINLQAQTESNIDSRLLEVFDATYLDRMQANHPTMFERLTFYLDNAWFISDYPSEKGNPDYPEVEIQDLAQINILKLEADQALVRSYEQRSFYKIKGTNKILIYYSGQEFVEKFNASRE